MRMPRDIGTFHIIGIGGIGMSAIAEILLARGYSVQGSDQREGVNVARLRDKGIRVFVGHDPINLVGARHVVISTAVKPGNVELEAARQKGLPIIRRSEMLAELMWSQGTVSVTGTHGKTSTTSLIAHVFVEAGYDPTVITGGIINTWGSNARFGKGDWMIVEADESDGTFTQLPTQIGVVTNIDPEHLDYFQTVENMHREYEAFFRAIPFFGLAVAGIDHPTVREMVSRLKAVGDGKRVLSYGEAADADLRYDDVRVENGLTIFDAHLSDNVSGGSRVLSALSILTPGQHNVQNAVASIAVASEAGIGDDQIRASLESFSGVKRRFQIIGEWNGVSVIDDYAHHPVEISAVLQAARSRAKGRVIAVVEPHRYTRVRDLFGEFCDCFGDADSVVVAPLYSAGESPIEGIDQHSLADGIRNVGHTSVLAIDNARELVPMIQQYGRRDDMVICLGAGRSTEWAQALPDWLSEKPRLAGE